MSKTPAPSTEGGQMEAEPVIAVSVKMPNGEVRGFAFGDGNELEIGTLVQLVGILKALRAIMQVPQGESILSHCVTMVRRYEAGERRKHTLRRYIRHVVNQEGKHLADRSVNVPDPGLSEEEWDLIEMLAKED